MNGKWVLALLVGLAFAAHADDAANKPPQPKATRLAKGIMPPVAPTDEYDIKVHVVARKLEDAEFGPKEARVQVKRPTQIVYKVQGMPIACVADLRKAIRAELDKAKKAGMTPIGEIRAASKAPLDAVLLAMQAMRAEKLEAIEFYGTAIPPRDVRRSRILPYPKNSHQSVR